MNAETREILSEYISNKLMDEELDENDRMDSYEEMEDQVWGVFADWSNEDWESAETKLIRVNQVYG